VIKVALLAASAVLVAGAACAADCSPGSNSLTCWGVVPVTPSIPMTSGCTTLLNVPGMVPCSASTAQPTKDWKDWRCDMSADGKTMTCEAAEPPQPVHLWVRDVKTGKLCFVTANGILNPVAKGDKVIAVYASGSWSDDECPTGAEIAIGTN